MAHGESESVGGEISKSDLIGRFYATAFGDAIAPPRATAAELELAAEVLKRFGVVAVGMLPRIIEATRSGFPTFRRFEATRVAWSSASTVETKKRKRLDAAVKSTEETRRRDLDVAAERDRFEAYRAEFAALPEAERRRFFPPGADNVPANLVERAALAAFAKSKTAETLEVEK